MSDPKHPPQTAPIQVPVVVTKLPRLGMQVRFEASPEERAAIAAFLGILSVESLRADLLVAPWKRDGVAVTGRLSADVVQACVVTLDPLPEAIREPVDLVFLPETSKLARLPRPDDGELHLDPDGADIPETFSGDRIDLGAILCEALALSLDPYPRSADSRFPEFTTDPEPEPAADKVSPFAALGSLKAAISPKKT